MRTVTWTTKDEKTGKVYTGETTIAETIEEAIELYGAEWVVKQANNERIRLDKVNAKSATSPEDKVRKALEAAKRAGLSREDILALLQQA